MDYALIVYPLSTGFRQRFEAAVGAVPRYMSVPELRRMPPMQMFRELARLRPCRLFLPLEDQTSQALLSVLQGLAAVTRARHIEVVDWNLRRRRFYRWQLPGPAMSLACATTAGLARVRACRRDLARLVEQPRVELNLGHEKRAIYINANLWFGLKAGGSVGHVAGVVNALCRDGYALDYAAVEQAVLADPNVAFRAVAPLRHWSIPFESNLYRYHNRVVQKLLPLVQSNRYRFIYQRMSVGNYSGVALSRCTGTPLVIEYNGSEVWVQKNWGRPLRFGALAELAEEACLRHAHLVVTVSDVLRDELVARGVEPQRIVAYPNCIDPAVFNPEHFARAETAALRQSYGLLADDLVVMFLGTFGQWHGVEVLAEAIRTLAVEHAEWLGRHRVRFLLVGDGVKMANVRAIVSDPRCAAVCKLAGLVPQGEAPLHLAAADVLLSPHVPNADGSRFFGSPTKLFEYMAMGKAIVASDLEQISQVLAPALDVGKLPDGEPDANGRHTSVLCRPGSAAELVAGIRFLVERPEWRRQLGRAARAKALAEFTWDRHVAAILDRLEALGAGRSATQATSAHLRSAA